MSSAITRRSRYSRSPSEGISSPKRSKLSTSIDNHEQTRPYTSICVKNINQKISDLEIRDLCTKKFSKYGTHTVKIYHKNHERVAFVNFTNCDDAKKARHAKTGLTWENYRVTVEPVYYRRTVPAEQPFQGDNGRDRSPVNSRQHRRRSTPSPSPLPASYSSRNHHSSRHQRAISPDHSPPVPRSRSSRRPYSPFIPLPPDLADYINKTDSRHHSPVRQKKSSQTSRTLNGHRSRSPSSSSLTLINKTHADEASRTLLVENLERDISKSRLKDIFGRYGTIDKLDVKKSVSSSKRVCAVIQYENVDMAHKARQTMNGNLIGKYECKISYGV